MNLKYLFTGLAVTSTIGVLVWLGYRYLNRSKATTLSDGEWMEGEDLMEVTVRLDAAAR